MGLTAAERETNITWSDADKGIAHVYTSQGRIMRKLRKLAKLPGVRLVERHKDDRGRVTGEEWDLPLEHVGRLFPGKKRQISETQREARRQRMQTVRSSSRRVPKKIARPAPAMPPSSEEPIKLIVVR